MLLVVFFPRTSFTICYIFVLKVFSFSLNVDMFFLKERCRGLTKRLRFHS